MKKLLILLLIVSFCSTGFSKAKEMLAYANKDVKGTSMITVNRDGDIVNVVYNLLGEMDLAQITLEEYEELIKEFKALPISEFENKDPSSSIASKTDHVIIYAANSTGKVESHFYKIPKSNKTKSIKNWIDSLYEFRKN